jgi:hypothetical protein
MSRWDSGCPKTKNERSALEVAEALVDCNCKLLDLPGFDSFPEESDCDQP